MAIMGGVQSALQISAVNSSIEAQAESVNDELERSYMEAHYNARREANQAIEEGFVADIERRQSVGDAKVHNASLGIRGTTAGENIGEQQRIGLHNVNTAKEARENADSAHQVSTGLSLMNATSSLNALEAQAPTPFESLISIGAGSLGGYITGAQVQTNLGGMKLAEKVGK